MTARAKTVPAGAALAGKGSISADAKVLSVGELAERISPHGSNLAGIRERIRHWTREGLLIPEGIRNPGTGRHRRYDELNVIDASILNVLADQGINVVGREMLYALARAREEARRWQTRSKKDLQFFMQLVSIRTQSGYEHTADVYTGRVPKLPAAEVSIVVNLGHLFSRLQMPDLRK
jgi:DNA-binding transcriptional MerR regulator